LAGNPSGIGEAAVIPLNQLIPECLLALGGAFLLGNLAAYIRLRPAWRDAKRGQGGEAPKRNAKATAGTTATGRSGRADPAARGSTGRDPAEGKSSRAQQGQARAQQGQARTGRVRAAAGPRAGSSGRVNARVREPTGPGQRLPSRARVLTNVVIGLVISVAALATLLRG
jgi:hypothetical protein